MNKGFAILESIIGIAIGMVIIIAFAAMLDQAQKVTSATGSNFQAALYLREGIEVAKDLEQSNWAALSTSTCAAPIGCHPAVSSTPSYHWTLVSNSPSSSEMLDGKFARSITISEVNRNSASFPNTITSTPGVIDPNTKKVTASVTWASGSAATRTIMLDTYVYH